jgi:signal transduction histidine kinase/ligand-binding sensor domain-containing protein
MKPSLCRALMTGIFLFSLPAAVDATTNSAWSVHTWQSDDGLPNNNVTGLAQTDDGYLWIANPSRLARFDGHQFEDILTTEIDSASWRQKAIVLLNGRKGGLWIGMTHGVVAYLSKGKPQVFTNGLPDEPVESLTEDAEDSLWITYRDKVCRLKNGKVISFGIADGLTTSYACCLALDIQSNLWFAKGSKAGIFQNGRFVTLIETTLPINGIAAAAKGGIWINDGNRLLHSDRNGNVTDCGVFLSQKVAPNLSPIFEDDEHNVWIGTADNGLFCYNGSNFEEIPVSHREISALLQDNEGNVWAGTAGGGLNRVNLRAIELEGKENGLPFEVIQSLCEITNGIIWAVTQNGFVACCSNGVWSVTISNRTSGGMGSCVAADSHGTVWIGTRGAQLDAWRNGAIKIYDKSDGLAGRVIHALLVSKSGDVWIGEENPDAIQRLRDGKFFTFKLPPHLGVIRAAVEDNSSNIWMGTSQGELLRFTGDDVVDETASTTGMPLSIRCLSTTTDGAIWIGYAGWGVGRLKDGRFSRISAEQGLYDYNISQIIADGNGWMWFGADHGIFKVRQQELESVMDGHRARLQCIHYGRDEDLPSLQANFGDSSGSLRTSDGRLWMPMRSALAVIDPEKISANKALVNARLEKVIVDDTIVGLYGGVLPVRNAMDLNLPHNRLKLPPGYHRLEFDFTAPNFTAPENIHFQYRLQGYDSHWTMADPQRMAVYPRLPSGNYQFQVSACNSDGVWNDAGAVFAFNIAPFFWQTWWFRFSAILLFTALVVAVVRYLSFRRLRLKLQKLEQQAALDKERARIARDIHDDLGGRFTEIELLVELTKRTPPEKLNGEMHQLSTTVRQAGQSLDEIVWATNPRHDTLPHLMDYLSQYATRFLKAAGIRCRVDFPDKFPPQSMPPEIRHNLFLTVKEALNNAARHSEATEIWLRASFTETSLTIVIEDNGKGFADVSNALDADGLGNMRQRMEEAGGRFQLESKAGSGTRIILTLMFPLKITSPSSVLK